MGLEALYALWFLVAFAIELTALGFILSIAWRFSTGRPRVRPLSLVGAAALWITLFYGKIVLAAALLQQEPIEVVVADNKAWCENVSVVAGSSWQGKSETFIPAPWPHRLPDQSHSAEISAYPDAFDCLPFLLSGAAKECVVGSEQTFPHLAYDANTAERTAWREASVSMTPACVEAYQSQIPPGQREWPLFKDKLKNSRSETPSLPGDQIAKQCFTYRLVSPTTPTIAVVSSLSQDTFLGIVRARFEHRLIDLPSGQALVRSRSAVYLRASATINPWMTPSLVRGETLGGADMYYRYRRKNCGAT